MAGKQISLAPRRPTRSNLRLQPTNNYSIGNPGTSVGEGTPTDRALRNATLTFDEIPIEPSSPASVSPSPAPRMASRSRNGRGGVRGGKEEGQELLMWNDIRDAWFNLKDIAAQSDRLARQILELEAGIKTKELAGQSRLLRESRSLPLTRVRTYASGTRCTKQCSPPKCTSSGRSEVSGR